VSAAHSQPAANGPAAAARDLARRTAALAGHGEPVTVAWRDLTPSGSAALAAARTAFEAALRDSGGRLSEISPAAEVRITLSENPSQYLLVEEIRKGDDHQVWIAAWPRSVSGAASPLVLLETRLLWEQKEPMLDVFTRGDSMLVLSAGAVTAFGRSGDSWQPRESAPIPPRNWPRDLRGRLRSNAGPLQVHLPGVVCGGPALASLSCHSADDSWALESGSALLLAAFTPGRNYFDGHVVTQSGVRKTVPPFYSAAALDDAGRLLWLLATVDSGTQIFDAALDPVGPAGAWGSDIAGVDTRCGGRSLVLATRPGDGQAPDAIQAWAVVNGATVPTGAPAEFPGPVTALWPSAGGATAVVRNAATGLSQAYAVTVTCAQ
jgi:hypothetical protein